MDWQHIMLPGVEAQKHPTLFTTPSVVATVEKALVQSQFEDRVGRPPTSSEALKALDEVLAGRRGVEKSTDQVYLSSLIDLDNVAEVPDFFIDELNRTIDRIVKLYEHGEPGRMPHHEEIVAAFCSAVVPDGEQSTERLFGRYELSDSPSSKARTALTMTQNLVDNMLETVSYDPDSIAGTARKLELVVDGAGNQLLVQFDIDANVMAALDSDEQIVVRSDGDIGFDSVKQFFSDVKQALSEVEQ